MEQPVEQSLRVARMIASSLMSGVVLFWIVGWVLTSGGQAGTAPVAYSPALVWLVWVVVALPGFVGALAFRRRALAATERSASQQSDVTISRVGQIQTNLVISWALLEGPALLSGVFFLLSALEQLLWAAAPVYLIGMSLTFPRAEWFREPRRSTQDQELRA